MVPEQHGTGSSGARATWHVLSWCPSSMAPVVPELRYVALAPMVPEQHGTGSSGTRAAWHVVPWCPVSMALAPMVPKQHGTGASVVPELRGTGYHGAQSVWHWHSVDAVLRAIKLGSVCSTDNCCAPIGHGFS